MNAFTPPANPEADSIRRRTAAEREADATDFAALRALGIDRSQKASGRVWTDYNLHDPGVTILEQLAFALTELAYRSDFPVADHLTGADGRIDFEAQALYPPEEILPCRPTTADDYRRVLLDQVQGLSDVRFAKPGAPHGLHRLRIRLGHDAAGDDATEAAKRRVCEVFQAHRALAEDLDANVEDIETATCDLILDAAIEGLRDPTDILADIYHACARRIANPPHVRTLDDLVVEGQAPDGIFDGPETMHGRIDTAALNAGSRGRRVLNDLREELAEIGGVQNVSRLVLNDLREELLQIGGVQSIGRLELTFEGTRAPNVVIGVLTWPPEVWAPRLRTPDRFNPGQPGPNVRLRRRGHEAPINVGALQRRYADGLRPDHRPANRPFDRIVPRPRGKSRPSTGWTSVQHLFPPLYGLREPPGGDAITPEVDQLRGYLSLFDQALADGAAQLAHLRELYSADRRLRRSYWRTALDDTSSPGIKAMRLPEGAEPAPLHGFVDHAHERRGRALDYLLALHGETLPQHTSRQYLFYLDPDDLAETLLRNKIAYLEQLVVLSRDRAAGVDLCQEPWGSRDWTPGLHRRIALLLGFPHWHARALAVPLGGLRPARRPADGSLEADRSNPTHLLSWPRRAQPTAAIRGHVDKILRNDRLHARLLVDGAWRRRYRWRPATGGGVLLLRPESDRDPWVRLGEALPDPTIASHVADALRRRVLATSHAYDGLHIVEHILLRPRAKGAPQPAEFFQLQATFVFPNWTARTARPDFRAFAEETVRLNCPAHVTPHCVWLSFRAMARFEGLYRKWLGLLQQHTRGDDVVSELDRTSADLTDLLMKALKT